MHEIKYETKSVELEESNMENYIEVATESWIYGPGMLEMIAYRLESLREVLEQLKKELYRTKNLNWVRIERLLFKVKSVLEALTENIKVYNDLQRSFVFNKLMEIIQKAQKGEQLSIFDLINLQTYEVPLDSIKNAVEYITIVLPFVGECKAEVICREKVYEAVSRVEAIIENISGRLGVYISPLVQLVGLKSLIAKLGLNENWIVAIAYLQSLEITVNKLVKELEIQVNEEAGFKDKFRTLIRHLKEKAKIEELTLFEKKLPEIFWDLRHKVVHAGYSPRKDELNTIIQWTTKILEKLIEAKAKIARTNTLTIATEKQNR